MKAIPEKDWKLLRTLKDEKLATFCEGIFEKIQKLMEKKEGGSHQAYLDLWGLLRDEDEKMAEMFDDLRRSTAVQRLGAWRRYGMLTDADLERFTEGTAESIVNLSEP